MARPVCREHQQVKRLDVGDNPNQFQCPACEGVDVVTEIRPDDEAEDDPDDRSALPAGDVAIALAMGGWFVFLGGWVAVWMAFSFTTGATAAMVFLGIVVLLTASEDE